MKELPDLKQLIEEAKEALIVELWEEIQKLKKELYDIIAQHSKQTFEKVCYFPFS